MTRSAQPPGTAGAVLTIDLAALAHNYRTLQSRAAPARCAGVIKADGYGLGAGPVAQCLHDAGCRTFFTALLGEALQVREICRDSALYVFGGLPPGAAAQFARAGVRPVLNTLEEIAEWRGFCQNSGSAPPAALHVDTGMNRLGLSAGDVEVLATSPAKLEGIEVALVMSHLACADEPAHAMNTAQLAAFQSLRARLPEAPASLANSAGIFGGAAFHFDLVRPGIALYGGNPVAGAPSPVRPVARLKARVLQVRDLGPGDTVGYGATFTSTRGSRIAVLAAGYGDGYSRALGGTPAAPPADIWLAGGRAPLAGRVSMDMIAADITGFDAGAVRAGDWAELIGEHIGIDELAERAGTIAYEVLTSLGTRFERIYTGGAGR